MGVKVGRQALQRMVSDYLKSLQPHTHIYIDDLLTGTRPKVCGKGKMLDPKAYLEDHFQNVVKSFEKLEECHLKVHFEKCHLFMERIKYCGHILHGGMRGPAPSKVDAVRNSPKPKTPKQMKGFLGVVNWYSIYIRNFSNIAAPLMTSLQGKHERVPGVDGRKAHCRVPRERNWIQWTPEIKSVFVQLKEALSAECELYIPSPDGEYRIHVDACDRGVGAVLEQQDPEGEWKPPPYFEGAGCERAGCRGINITKIRFTASVCTKICHFSCKNGQKWPFFGQQLSFLASEKQLKTPPPLF